VLLDVQLPDYRRLSGSEAIMAHSAAPAMILVSKAELCNARVESPAHRPLTATLGAGKLQLAKLTAQLTNVRVNGTRTRRSRRGAHRT
jgi:hypothetical protein